MAKSRPFRLDLTNQRFGKLLVLGKSHKNKRGEILWKCLCDCGNHCTPSAAGLRKGNSTTCGCGRIAAITKHGKTKTPTFKSWDSMLQRCTNPNDPSYPRYGGKGIKVCERWAHSFENFLEDMGERPSGKTLDRIDTCGLYEPKNCRWATAREQQANREITKFLTFDGETLPVTWWPEKVGISLHVIRSRIRAGWPDEKVLSQPVRKKAAPK